MPLKWGEIKMNCPKCKKEMKKAEFDVGYGIKVKSMHCLNCGFNLTENKKMQKALNSLREKMSKEVKIVRIGSGIGIRFPNAFVKAYQSQAGKSKQLKAETDGIKIVA